MDSKIESVLDLIRVNLENITPDHAPLGRAVPYRSNVLEVIQGFVSHEEANNLPTLCLMATTEDVEAIDDTRTVFNEIVDVLVIGYYTAERTVDGSRKTTALEESGRALVHDLKRCVASITSWYAHTTTPDGQPNTLRWQVAWDEEMPVFDYGFEIDKTRGWVGAAFKVLIWAVDGDF